MKKRITKLVADIALKSAKSSDWQLYQPKEPAALKKFLK